MTVKQVLIFLLLCVPLLASGQKKEYLLSGKVYIDHGPACSYFVSFTTEGSKVSGRSVTVQPDGRELNALIHGELSRSNRTLNFKEAKMPLTLEPDNCMFDVQLTYKGTEGNYVFSGPFTGNSDNEDSCDAGIMKLELKQGAWSDFEPVHVRKKEAVPKAPAADTPTGKPIVFEKITAALVKELDWKSDSCVLEIWDGEVVDGDIVTLKLNGAVVLQSYTLAAAKKRIVLPVKLNMNVITIYAENEGKAPPNTSMIQLTDGKMQYGVLACIRKGETAEIKIRKK